MKTIEFLVILIQLFVPGAQGVGDALLACVLLIACVRDNPYARIVEAFRNARCAEVKTISLNQTAGDTLIVDAFQPYYSPEFKYPYSLLYCAENKNNIVLREKGFTDGRQLRISVSEPGRYYLMINDVNRSMLEFVVGPVGASQRLAPSSFALAELKIGCVVHE